MISGENTDTITYVNRKIVGHVELTKTDDTTAKTPIEGALFDLYKVVEDAAVSQISMQMILGLQEIYLQMEMVSGRL